MSTHGFVSMLLYFGVLLALSIPLGRHMARVYERPAVGRFERIIYRVCGVNVDEDMSWKKYAACALAFNLFGILLAYAIQRAQHLLPLNPQHLPAVGSEVAFNTAVSFGTNTNWQAYCGETTMSYLTQMTVMTVQNFVSAAAGMAVAVALIRGFVRRQADGIGNFWVDLTRSTLYVLMPLSIILAIVLMTQGVPQTFNDPIAVAPIEQKQQLIAIGPVASQIAIKQLGTNGGGYFNMNSAHPFENPTPLSNFIEVLSILLIASAFAFTFGEMVKDRRQGWAIWLAMFLIVLPLTIAAIHFEEAGTAAIAPNMEGKEVRFGAAESAIWAVMTTAASNGSVNAMHDSFTPLGGLIPMWLMQLGEIVFGGVGSGLYGMLLFAIVAVFISGLMVGRTPEYLGKKIEAYEMKASSLGILLPCASVLVGTAIACVVPETQKAIANSGTHGFSEILYAFSSSSNNNGSAFAGLTANGVFYATAQGITMLIGRYWVMIPVLALAGSLAKKKYVPPSSGTLPTHTPLFIGLLIGTVVLIGALSFIPALALGPIVEHLQMLGVK